MPYQGEFDDWIGQRPIDNFSVSFPTILVLRGIFEPAVLSIGGLVLIGRC